MTTKGISTQLPHQYDRAVFTELFRKLEFLESRDIKFTNQTPATASSTGKAGTVVIDSTHIYVCVATDTWKRVAIATW